MFIRISNSLCPNPSWVEGARLSRLLLVLALLFGSAKAGFAQREDTHLLTQLRAEPSMEARLELAAALLKRVELMPNDVLEADVRFELGVAFISLERFKEAKEQFLVAQPIAKRLDDSTSLAHMGWHLGLISYHLGDFEYGLAQVVEGARLAGLVGQAKVEWRCYNVKGLIEERLGDYAGALESFALGITAAENADERDSIATILGSIGIAQMNLGEYGQAYECYLRVRALEIAEGSPAGTSSTLANLGDACSLLAKYDEAYEFHAEALQMRIEAGVEVELARSYHSLAVIHLWRDEYALALNRFEEALEIRERLELLPDQMATLLGMSLVYSALDEDEKADSAALASLSITDELGMLGRRRSVLVALARLQEEQGNYESALQTFSESVALTQELHSRETARNYAEFEAKLDSKEKQRQIATLTAERVQSAAEFERQALVRRSLIGGSVLLALIAAAGWSAWATLRRTHRALTVANEAVRLRGEELESAASRIKRLEGMLPICSHCKSIRDEAGSWHSLERFVTHQTKASFTHSICPHCLDAHYSEELASDALSQRSRA